MIRKRRNQKAIPTPKTEGWGKNQIDNTVLILRIVYHNIQKCLLVYSADLRRAFTGPLVLWLSTISNHLFSFWSTRPFTTKHFEQFRKAPSKLTKPNQNTRQSCLLVWTELSYELGRVVLIRDLHGPSCPGPSCLWAELS